MFQYLHPKISSPAWALIAQELGRDPKVSWRFPSSISALSLCEHGSRLSRLFCPLDEGDLETCSTGMNVCVDDSLVRIVTRSSREISSQPSNRLVKVQADEGEGCLSHLWCAERKKKRKEDLTIVLYPSRVSNDLS